MSDILAWFTISSGCLLDGMTMVAFVYFNSDEPN